MSHAYLFFTYEVIGFIYEAAVIFGAPEYSRRGGGLVSFTAGRALFEIYGHLMVGPSMIYCRFHSGWLMTTAIILHTAASITICCARQGPLSYASAMTCYVTGSMQRYDEMAEMIARIAICLFINTRDATEEPLF